MLRSAGGSQPVSYLQDILIAQRVQAVVTAEVSVDLYIEETGADEPLGMTWSVFPACGDRLLNGTDTAVLDLDLHTAPIEDRDTVG